MKSSLRKVIMSKKVAEDYLERVSKEASTLTVYFTAESQLTRFSGAIKDTFGNKVSSSRGFDYVTFLSEDRSVIEAIHERAVKTGCDFSGF